MEHEKDILFYNGDKIMKDTMMQKYKFVILGSKGHGKTSLHAAIQKVKNLTNKENITVYADLISSNARACELISVLQQSKTVVIVISAEDGVNPKVREYALLSRQVGVEKVVAYINKQDKVDNRTIETTKSEIEKILLDYYDSSENIKIIYGSALKIVESNSNDYTDNIYKSIVDLFEF